MDFDTFGETLMIRFQHSKRLPDLPLRKFDCNLKKKLEAERRIDCNQKELMDQIAAPSKTLRQFGEFLFGEIWGKKEKAQDAFDYVADNWYLIIIY